MSCSSEGWTTYRVFQSPGKYSPLQQDRLWLTEQKQLCRKGTGEAASSWEGAILSQEEVHLGSKASPGSWDAFAQPQRQGQALILLQCPALVRSPEQDRALAQHRHSHTGVISVEFAMMAKAGACGWEIWVFSTFIKWDSPLAEEWGNIRKIKPIMWGSKHGLEHGKFKFKIKKIYLTFIRVVKQWNKISAEAGAPLSVEMFKSKSKEDLSNAVKPIQM